MVEKRKQSSNSLLQWEVGEDAERAYGSPLGLLEFSFCLFSEDLVLLSFVTIVVTGGLTFIVPGSEMGLGALGSW